MPRADLAFLRPLLMSGDRSDAPIQLVGPDLERPWPGSCACSTPTPWASSAEPWTPELSAGPGQQKARTTISTAPTTAMAICSQLAIALGDAAAMVLRPPSPRRSHAPTERRTSLAWSRSGGGRWFAVGRDRNDAAPVPNSPGPSTHPTGTGTDKPPGAPAPRASAEPWPRIHPAGIRPVGPPTAKGGCLVPCPESERCSWRASPRASC